MLKRNLTGQPGTCLYCPECGATYSATPGDYFWAPDDHEFTCEDCDVPMHEARKVTEYVYV